MGCKVDQGIWFSDEDWKQRRGTQAQWGWDGELKGLVRLGCCSTWFLWTLMFSNYNSHHLLSVTVLPGTVLVDKSYLIKSCCQLYEIILLGQFYRRNQSSKRCFNVFKATWLLQARAGIWIRFFDFTASPEVPLLYCLLNYTLHHLSVCWQVIFLSPHFHSSFFPLQVSTSPAHKCQAHKSSVLPKFCSDLINSGRASSLSMIQPERIARLHAWHTHRLSSGRMGGAGTSAWQMAPFGCLPRPDARGSACSPQGGGWAPGPVILTCVAGVRACGYIWSMRGPGCVPPRLHICMWPVCVCMCICVHADEWVCVCLAACFWVCMLCVCRGVCVHLNFEFAFILVCVLKNMKCWEGQRERERGWSYALRSQPFERPCLQWRVPAYSPLQFSPHPRTEWHELQWEVIPFPRWSLSSELSFRFLKTTSWLRFLSKVEVLKFLWIRPPLKIC